MSEEYILDTLSLDMLRDNAFPCDVYVADITDYFNLDRGNVKSVMDMYVRSGYKSCIRDSRLARVIGVECSGETVALSVGDRAVVVRYCGEELLETASEFPDSGKIKLYRVIISYPNTPIYYH